MYNNVIQLPLFYGAICHHKTPTNKSLLAFLQGLRYPLGNVKGTAI